MLPRCGRVAHICEANLILQFVFPAAIAFKKTVQFIIGCSLWSKLQIRTRQRGNCGTLVGKSRGGTPFCRTWKNGFSKRSCSWKTNCVRFGRIASLSAFVLFASGCVVRIAFECFLDCSLQEVFCFWNGEQHFYRFLLDFNFISSIPLLRGKACPP